MWLIKIDMENPLLEIMQLLPSGCKLGFEREIYGQVSVTLVDTETAKEAKAVIPMDHHLGVEQVKSVLMHLHSKIRD